MSYAMIILVPLNDGCAKTRSLRAASSLKGFWVVEVELPERGARELAGCFLIQRQNQGTQLPVKMTAADC